MGVIILHFNNAYMGKALFYVKNGSINFYILYFIESLCICAVNLFILITGYFMCQNNKRYILKPLKLLAEVSFFSESTYVIKHLISGEPVISRELLYALLPVNWFVILYITLYFISPYLNIWIHCLSKKKMLNMIVIWGIIFSVYPTVLNFAEEIIFGGGEKELSGLSSVGLYGSQYGYTIINFILCYLTGAYIRISDRKYYSLIKSLTLICGNVLILSTWALVDNYTGFSNERSAWAYCNPFVILLAVLIFLLFLQLEISANTFINSLAGGSFAVYLLHNNFVRFLPVEKIVSCNPCIMLLFVILSSAVIYTVCWLIGYFYEKMTRPIYMKLAKYISFPVLDLSP